MKNPCDSQNKACKGFTLIELLVALVIIGILVAAGVPGMQLLLGNMSVRSNTDRLITSLSYTRGEAVARVANVSIRSISDGTDWSTGWRVFVDVNGSCTIDGVDEILRVVDNSSESATVNATTNATACIAFNRLGENAAGVERGFTVDHANGDARGITVSTIGYASVD